jgi:hypothetical protein
VIRDDDDNNNNNNNNINNVTYGKIIPVPNRMLRSLIWAVGLEP